MSVRRNPSQESLPDQVEAVVIGGGQAGLSAGYHLRRSGADFVILDAHHRVGDSWRARWDSLRLFTPVRYDGLPGMDFPGPASHYPGKDEVADFLEMYSDRFDLPVHTDCRVEGLGREADDFVVALENRSLRARNVIVATGFDNEPNLPKLATELDDEIVQLHSKEYRNPSQLQDGPVLVVGAGNSGAEIAIEVVSAGHETWLSGRDPGQEPTRAGSFSDRLLVPLMWFAATKIITTDRGIGRKVRDQFLDPPRGIPRGRVSRKDIREAGIEWVPRVDAVDRGRPVTEDGRSIDVANIVWCTGFKPGYDFIDLPLVKHGIPRHDRGVIETEPGLYFVGLYFQYSLSSPLLGGVGRDARYVVDHLTARNSPRSTDRAAPSQ